MSKIHEALKRAEQLRKTKSSATTSTSVPPEPESTKPAPRFLGLDELRNSCAKPAWKLDPNWMLFTNGNGYSPPAEQFRTLRSRLERLREKQPCRRLLVTSALPAEGKTLVASNLAQVIASQKNRSVLLIDADLRSSRLHLSLGAPPSPGLSDYLKGEADESAVIQCGSSDGLFFIPGGNAVSNPAELLADSRLRSLLDKVTPLFDWIILDSPPTLPVADAGSLATLCDGVLMVVLTGSTRPEDAQKACQEFRDKNILGVVLNRAKARETYYASYYSSSGKEGRG